jgi:hypothetical protein
MIFNKKKLIEIDFYDSAAAANRSAMSDMAAAVPA